MDGGWDGVYAMNPKSVKYFLTITAEVEAPSKPSREDIRRVVKHLKADHTEFLPDDIGLGVADAKVRKVNVRFDALEAR